MQIQGICWEISYTKVEGLGSDTLIISYAYGEKPCFK